MPRRSRASDYSEEELLRALHKGLQAIRKLEHARMDPGRMHPRPEQNPFVKKLDEPRNKPKRRTDLTRPLLTIAESALVLLMIFLVSSALMEVGKLNQKTRDSWKTVPAAPTPLVAPVELPSGHAAAHVPVLVETARELFVHGYASPLRKMPASVADRPAEVEFATRIKIPAINVDAPVVMGVDKEQLKKGVGQIPGTAAPGKAGNLVLSAHNDIYGELFRYLDRLKPGDEFTVFTNLQAYTYIVTGWELVEPTQIEVLAPTSDATATLISCYPYLIDTMRIIVKARLIEA